MKKEFAEVMFEMAGFTVLSVHQLANEYWPASYSDRATRSPWWLVVTTYGAVKIGWRKNVIEITWTADVAEVILTNENVTRNLTLVHAWSYARALAYLTSLAQAARKIRAARAETARVNHGRRASDKPLTKADEERAEESAPSAWAISVGGCGPQAKDGTTEAQGGVSGAADQAKSTKNSSVEADTNDAKYRSPIPGCSQCQGGKPGYVCPGCIDCVATAGRANNWLDGAEPLTIGLVDPT